MTCCLQLKLSNLTCWINLSKILLEHLILVSLIINLKGRPLGSPISIINQEKKVIALIIKMNFKIKNYKIILTNNILWIKIVNGRAVNKMKMTMTGKRCGKIFMFKFKNVLYRQVIIFYMILWLNMYNLDLPFKNYLVM